MQRQMFWQSFCHVLLVLLLLIQILSIQPATAQLTLPTVPTTAETAEATPSKMQHDWVLIQPKTSLYSTGFYSAETEDGFRCPSVLCVDKPMRTS